MTAAVRRRSGLHLTPDALARALVGLIPDVGGVVLDPAVGGGVFLLAAADELLRGGLRADDALDALTGYDIDPGAVAVAEAALALWALDNGAAPRRLERLRTGDGLLDRLPPADVVVANPPFLNQLRSSSSNTVARRSALRERWADLVGAYTDDAWLFLAAGLDALVPGGALVMIEPVSVLAARHGAAIRARVQEHAELTDLWVARERVFDASVNVCAIGLRKLDEPDPTRPVRRWLGPHFERGPDTDGQPAPDGWGRAAAISAGVPSVSLTGDRSLGSLASATAGFRDQFYGLVPFVDDLDGRLDFDAEARLVTVGMIDPFTLRWGDDTFSFAKRRLRRPVVDIGRLADEDPRLFGWVEARRRPKVLVATQTRIVEAWVDERGASVPTTPVVSVEPIDERDLWLIAAVVAAPAVTAHLAGGGFGTALSLDALKVTASDLLEVPLPVRRGPWTEAAAVARSLVRAGPPANRAETGRRRTDLAAFAALMSDAYEVDDPALVPWWLGRLPNRRASA